MFEAVAVDEVAFAMSLFVAAANRMFAGIDSQAAFGNADALEGRRLFLAVSVLPMEPLDEAKQTALLESSLYRAFQHVWEQYRGDARRTSICARVLGFCYLMERTRGAIAGRWAMANLAGPEEVLLEPALVQAIATTVLSARGTMSERVLTADIERVSRDLSTDTHTRLENAQSLAELPPPSVWPAGASEMAELMRTRDWLRSPLGDSQTWPQSLRTAVELTLACSFPMIVLWGIELMQFYNDAYRDIMGVKHPAGLGQSTRDCWPEVWRFNEPIYRRVLDGETLTFEDQLFPITRYGYLEQAYFTLCYSPIWLESKVIAGVLVTVFETTARLRAGVSHGESEPLRKPARDS